MIIAGTEYRCRLYTKLNRVNMNLYVIFAYSSILYVLF